MTFLNVLLVHIILKMQTCVTNPILILFVTFIFYFRKMNNIANGEGALLKQSLLIYFLE